MKRKKIFLFLFLTVSISAYSQATFENGYFINKSNQKIDCLIKNMDWKNNPAHFEYKLSETADIQTADTQTAMEFGINGMSKYISAQVNIDRSGNSPGALTAQKDPIFKEEQLFLKALVEGNASLFSYESKGLVRFFFKTGASELQQLVYKRYLSNGDEVLMNNLFRQQLFSSLTCQDITVKDVTSLTYNKKDLERLFVAYNECTGSSYQNYREKTKKDLFHLSVRPGLNISALGMQNAVSEWDTSFDKEFNFRFGIETELFLPFNNGRWSIILEPTYQSYQSEKQPVTYTVSGQIRIAKIAYQSIELPVGFRGHFFLNDKSKIFVNASLILDFDTRSSIELIKSLQSTFDSQFLAIKSGANIGLGIGYSYAKRYSLEVRYQTSREILRNYSTWDSTYKTLSFIVGYRIF
jgi:hypothetical protein